MVKDQDFVAIFHSIHRVLKAEKALKAVGEEFLLIPVPRQLTSDCGLALRFSPDHRAHILAQLAIDDLSPVEVYQRQGRDYVLIKGRKP